MLSTIKKAGLTPREFGDLVGVSRIAVYNWISKPPRAHPHKLITPAVEKALHFLRDVTARKELPLDEKLTRAERAKKLEQMKARLGRYSVD